MAMKQSWLWCLALAALAGCSGGDNTKRVIFVTNGDSPYWAAAKAGLDEANQELKLADAGLRAVMVTNDGTSAGQIEKLRQFGSQSDVAAVAISVNDANNQAIVDELKALRAKGIPVITVDSDVNREKFRDARLAFIGTDNFAGGKALGACLANLLPEGGEYVTFVGITGAQNAIDRVGGIEEGAGPSFKRLDNMGDQNDLTAARENVRQALKNHPQLNALVGIWAYNAPAIVDVVKEKGVRDQVKVVVFDAQADTVKHMRDGQVDAMVVQDPYQMGYKAVQLMTAAVKKDDAAIAELLPNLKDEGGDILDTGLKVVVPDKNSPLKPDMFPSNTQFYTLEEFQAWLDKYQLTSS